MERLIRSDFLFIMRTYCMLTKPGILFGNAITAVGGFALASRGHVPGGLLLATLAGLSLIMASACVFNNYIDRELDEKMMRTKNRALAQGLISSKHALLFAIFLVLLGTFFLVVFTNLLTVLIALLGFFVYVVVYSFLKYRSIYATWVGSIAGATPPVVGYCSVSNDFDVGALLLFGLIATWQMPHFFAITLYRLRDYAAASIPILPLKKGIWITKVCMLLYVVAFIVVSSLFTLFSYTDYTYLIVITSLGFVWLGLSVKGFSCDNNALWARKMFLFSLVIVMVLSIMMPLSVI